MSTLKSYLSTVVEIVVFLFAAFGAHLSVAAPPASPVGGMNPQFPIGVASFAALLVFLVAKTWAPAPTNTSHRRMWAWSATGLALAYVLIAMAYGSRLSSRTFVFVPEQGESTVAMVGDSYTTDGQSMVDAYRASHGGVEPRPLALLRAGGENDLDKIPLIWEPNSIADAHAGLVMLYVLMVVVLCGAVASLVELSVSG